MSIKVMTWVFGLTVEPRAKIALLAIADHADDDGIAWPSRDLIADKSSQSRTTVNRRMAYLVDLGVISVHERFRDDGSQTTDEIRINLSLTPEEVMRRAHGLKAACKAKNLSGEAVESDDDAASEFDTPPIQLDTPPGQPEAPPIQHVAPPPIHCGHPQSEPSVEPDRIRDARARASMLTEGSKALASAFWRALGITRPLDIPHQLAGIDYRAVMWEQHGWDVSLIETEARRFAGDDPPKPISYFEKCFATAFAKRQAPLPIVQVKQAEQLTVTRHGTAQQGSGIIQAADRLNAIIDGFDDGRPSSGPSGPKELCGQTSAPTVRLLPQG